VYTLFSSNDPATNGSSGATTAYKKCVTKNPALMGNDAASRDNRFATFHILSKRRETITLLRARYATEERRRKPHRHEKLEFVTLVTLSPNGKHKFDYLELVLPKNNA
jgi:hypothetical protein